MTKIHKNLEFDSNLDLSKADLPDKTVKVCYLPHADYEQTHAKMLAQTLARIEAKKNGQRSADALWVVEHNDVYTLGQAGKVEHILQRGNTPIIHTDRGGQVTWHGKGQLVLYWLFDLKNLGWSVRDLVSHAEQSLEDAINEALLSYPFSEAPSSLSLSLSQSSLQPEPQFPQAQATGQYYAKARQDAPGVYIYSKAADGDGAVMGDAMLDDVMLGKIASLGFKIKQGFSYHGIALNLNCDLSAFAAINPCGYAGMQMLRLADFVPLPPLTHANAPDKLKIAQDLTPDLSSKASYVNGTNKDTASLSNLQITQRLIDNIKQRQAGDIPLRVPSNLLHL